MKLVIPMLYVMHAWIYTTFAMWESIYEMEQSVTYQRIAEHQPYTI